MNECPKCHHVHLRMGWNIGAAESYTTCNQPTGEWTMCNCRYKEQTVKHTKEDFDELRMLGNMSPQQQAEYWK